MLGSYLLGFALQGAYFIVLARCLGASQYGLFAGALAIALVLSTLSGIGAGSVLVMRSSRNIREFAAQLGTALTYISLSFPVLAGIAFLVSHGATGGLISVLLPLLVSELFFTRILDLGYQSFQARDLLKWTALFNALAGFARLIGVITFALLSLNSVLLWGWVYAAINATLGTVVILVVFKRLGRPVMDVESLCSTWRTGAFFAVGMSSRTVYADADKYLLNYFGFQQDAGIYAAGSRLVNFAFAPIQALVYSRNSALFRVGIDGYIATWRLIRRIPFAVVLYGAIAGVALYFVSPLVPILLGESFSETSEILKMLAPVILLQGIHYLFGDALMGIGRQDIRSAAQLGVALIAVFLNIVLIPAMGWHGAICATIISSLTLAFVMVGCFIYGYRAEARGASGGEAGRGRGRNRQEGVCKVERS